MRSLLRISVLMLCMIWSESMQAQELEPRSLTNIPVGMNFGVMGYTWSQGNILLDPALSIEDPNANVHGLAAGYLRSINVFGKSGKIDVMLPFATGDWSGSANQEYRQTSRNGFGDPRIRVSINLLGAPALNKEGFQTYQQKTIFGVNVMVSMPLGQYFPDRLINLGSNRFTIRPQAGVSHSYEKWFFEANASIWFFTMNNDFYGGNELKQNPIYTFKIHAIRTLPKGIWLASDAGYANGGVTSVNGAERESHISTFRLGGTVSVPLGLHHSIKLFGFAAIRMDKGSDFSLLSLAYQFRWGGK